MTAETNKIIHQVVTDLEGIEQHCETRGRTYRAAISIHTDPIHGDAMGRELSIYSDDGRGNGEHIVTVRLVDLIDAARRYQERRDAIENPPSDLPPGFKSREELLEVMLPPIDKLLRDGELTEEDSSL